MRKFLPAGIVFGLLLVADLASAQASGPYSYYGIAPCRIIDTRNANGPVGGPALANGTPRDFPIVNQCGVPSTAKAVTLNVTLVSPTVDGFLKIYPVGVSTTVSNINALANTPAIANAVIVLLTAGTNNITAVFGTSQAGTAHMLVDVTGYFQ